MDRRDIQKLKTATKMLVSDSMVSLRRISMAIWLAGVSALVSGCSNMPSLDWKNPFEGPPPAYKSQYGLTPSQKVDRLRALARSASTMDVAHQENVTQELVATFNKENDPILRREIARTLGSLPTIQASDGLLMAMDDPHEQVRIAACEAWGRRGDPQAVDVLSATLAEDANVDVRLAASRALARRPGGNSLAHLAATLEDRDPAVQLATMQSLRRATGLNIGDDINGWLAYLNEQPTVIDSPSDTVPNRMESSDSAAQLASGQDLSPVVRPPVYEDVTSDDSIFR